jgi:hypothetical protein
MSWILIWFLIGLIFSILSYIAWDLEENYGMLRRPTPLTPKMVFFIMLGSLLGPFAIVVAIVFWCMVSDSDLWWNKPIKGKRRNGK